MTVALGPFDLISPAGRGAMAEVWLAQHRATQTSVAVKVVTATAGREARFRRLFAREVRAVAQLDHPSIVRVYERGELPLSVRGARDPRLPPGAPYLVMDWLGGGSLRQRMPMDWPTLRSTLLTLLDALAHAHARGVVHRDIKLDNVLFGAHGPVLTDFGLAWQDEGGHPESNSDRRRLMGTPNYMAPEQIKADDRSLGPWTDLYAVGCLGYALATGRPPFDRKRPMAVLQAQLTEDPPRLTEVHPLPPGFELWLRRLLAKEPAQRFRFAADAAVALMAIPDPTGPLMFDPSTLQPISHEPSLSDMTVVAPQAFVSITDTAWTVREGDTRPPMPQTWRPPEAGAPPTPLAGAGRALFELRAPTLPGRDAERDRLWKALQSALQAGRARGVVIEGRSGLGKTRLANWLGHRAHELGVAQPLRATHAWPTGPACGVGPMLERHFRCVGLPPEERLMRIGGWLGDTGIAQELVAWLDPFGRLQLGDATLAVQAAKEGREIVCRALRLLAQQRPLLLTLDDIQWGHDTLQLVRHIFAEASDLPVLVVMTLRDGADGPARLTRAALDALVESGPFERVHLDPVHPTDHAHLLRSMLPFSDELVEELVYRSAGSPVFAEELVRHWLSADLLESTPRGFRLRRGADATAPGDLQTLWWTRLERAVRPSERAAMHALELAATLGMQPDLAEWASACDLAGLPVPYEALERLYDTRLILPEGDGWAFAHPILREVLQRRAREAGRWALYNWVCAETLASLSSAAEDPGRRATHLLQAGKHALALTDLAATAKKALRSADFPTARQALVERFSVLRRLRMQRNDRDWNVTRVMLAEWAGRRGDHNPGLRWACRAERSARCAGQPRLLIEALVEKGYCEMRMTGRQPEALVSLSEAARRASELGDARLTAKTLIAQGTALLVDGQTEAASDGFESAVTLLEGIDAPELLGEALRKLTDTARRQGNLDLAWSHGQAAFLHYDRIGDRWSKAQVANTLGDILRYRGDLAGAVRLYRELERLARDLGIAVGIRYAEANQGFVLIELERYAEARPLLERALRDAVQRDDAQLVSCLNAALLPCDADSGDWAAWDARWPALDDLMTARRFDPDPAMAALHAMRLAEQAGDARRAGQARLLTIAQYEALGRRDEAAALRRDTSPMGLP